MFITIINDSRDGNAFGWQATRAASLFGCAVSTIGVVDDLEAAGNVVDALDAGEGREGIGEKRLLEIVVQGGSAAERFRLLPGSGIM